MEAENRSSVEHWPRNDPLTGLSSAHQMYRALDREFARARRLEMPLGLVVLDIDDFRRVNNTYGHPQGDVVLIAVASVLHELMRDIDEPVRWGGEEFVVVLPDTNLDAAVVFAERIRKAIERLRIPRADRSAELRVTASFGVACVPPNRDDWGKLLEAADQAMLRAKRAGKNRVEASDDETDGDAS